MKQQAWCTSFGKPMTIDMQVTGSNVESVAESEVMRILILVRNFVEGYKQVTLLEAHAHFPFCSSDGKILRQLASRPFF
jgi:hypothetical protein